MRWHPVTRTLLMDLGFAHASRDDDMRRGNWNIRPERNHSDGDDVVTQYPLTLEHATRGVVLKIFEPPMLDLLRMLG